jgi:hypothetical protein
MKALARAPVVVSMVLVDPAMLGLFATAGLLRDENIEKMPPPFFSLLTTLMRSDGVEEPSCMVFVSRKTWGKMPHLPLELVPDQHQ